MEIKTFTSYSAKTDGRMEEFRKTLNIIHAGTISLRKTATACFPWTDVRQVEDFAARGDMSVLRLRLTSVPFKSIKSFVTDSLLSFLDKNLIAYYYTWPSQQ